MGTNAVATVDERDGKRQQALLKAVGLDRVPPEQRELAMAIADRYSLDLLMKHLVLVDGRPYITRDGLLHIAHRSGSFDGIEVSDPTVIDVPGAGQFWSARASVWRKDMSRPFTYAGRYPTKGGNQRFAPEMAVKVAEVMALRRAFDVSAPVIEERWDLEQPAPDPTPAPTLDERIASRAQRVATTSATPDVPPVVVRSAEPAPEAPSSAEGAGDADIVDGEAVEVDAKPVQCDGFSDELGRCRKEQAHEGPHRNAEGTWPA